VEPNQYKYMFEAEDQHWWYVGNHEIFLNILERRNILRPGISVLDAGCGTGRWLEILKNYCDINETGIDNREVALSYASTRTKMNLVCGDINTYIFKESSFDLITCFDVIYHREVDDEIAIKKFNKYLKNEGYLLLTVPAYSFLYSKHDQVVHTNKRYTKKQIKFLLKNNGFEIVQSTYCVSLLFPIALIKRIVDKLTPAKDTEHNEVEMPVKIVNQFFLFIMRMENFLLRYISLPFGLSVLVLAKKPL
jgi:SAM-dependent methyltransferase